MMMMMILKTVILLYVAEIVLSNKILLRNVIHVVPVSTFGHNINRFIHATITQSILKLKIVLIYINDGKVESNVFRNRIDLRS